MPAMGWEQDPVAFAKLAVSCLTLDAQPRGAGNDKAPSASVSWSYHWPSGVVCPVDTMRSMRTPGRSTGNPTTSSGSGRHRQIALQGRRF